MLSTLRRICSWYCGYTFSEVVCYWTLAFLLIHIGTLILLELTKVTHFQLIRKINRLH